MLTWNKAAGGGIGAGIASYIVDALNQASTIYLQLPIPDFAQVCLLGLITALITYYVPANAIKTPPVDSSKSGT